jgi:hypothetical protein
MFTCVALALGLAAPSASLAAEVEAGARALSAQTELTPALTADIEDFSSDAERLSAALREAGADQDLPCIFHGIAEDARARARELEAADTEGELTAALAALRVLLDDAILIAPMAGDALGSGGN